MVNYLAVYDIKIQPFEEAPEWEKRNYDIVANDDADARKQAEDQRINLLRNELLPGSTVTLERLVKIENI